MPRLNAMNRVLLNLRHPLLPLSATLPSTRSMNSNKHHNNQLPFSSFSTSTKPSNDLDLSTKICVPCDSKELKPMTQDAAYSLIPQVSEWNLVNEGGSLKLTRSWKVKSFNKGLEFFRIIADLAEAQGHHPDLHLVGWNNVTIEIWTHSVGLNISVVKYLDYIANIPVFHIRIWLSDTKDDIHFNFATLNISAVFPYTGGLTENDFILAAKINELNVHGLLRKKASD